MAVTRTVDPPQPALRGIKLEATGPSRKRRNLPGRAADFKCLEAPGVPRFCLFTKH